MPKTSRLITVGIDDLIIDSNEDAQGGSIVSDTLEDGILNSLRKGALTTDEIRARMTHKAGDAITVPHRGELVIRLAQMARTGRIQYGTWTNSKWSIPPIILTDPT